MYIKNKKKSAYIATNICLGLLLFFLSIKGHEEYIVENDAGQIIEQFINYSPIVLLLRSFSLQISTVIFVILIFLSLRGNKVKQQFLSAPTLYNLALCLFFIRLIFDSTEDVGKVILAIFFNMGFYFFCWHGTKKSKLDVNPVDGIMRGLVLFFVLFVWTNIIIFLAGQGLVEGGARFFGITQHPNFLGAISAHSAVGLLGYFIFAKPLSKEKLIISLSLIIAVILVYLSGSRTALLMMSFGFLLTLIRWVKNENNLRISPTNITLIGMLGFLLVTSLPNVLNKLTDTNDIYNRFISGENTREDAWNILINTFINNPIVGAGYAAGASESSLLKLSASAGAIPGLLLLISFYIVAKNSTKIILHRQASSFGPQCMAILSMVTILGSFFEGYLIQQGGYGPLLYTMEASCICTFITFQYKRKNALI